MLKLMPNLNAKRGFTLIELLVVISIIAILITLIVATFGTTQQKARDSRRKTDLDALKKALELFKGDTPGSSWYPNCQSPLATSCNPAIGTDFEPDLDVKYIKKFPLDPSTKSGYTYIPTGCQNVGSPAVNYCASYSIVACLENGKDANADSPKYPACTTDASYTITNP